MNTRMGIRHARPWLLLLGFVAVMRMPLLGQSACIRIMDQDSTLNNLIDQPGLVTSPLGTLGRVEKVGTGPQAVILIPGMGFGGEVFREFMETNKDKYTMYAVTLAGFGGTPPPPSPAGTVSYGEQTWTNAALEAIGKLIETENMRHAVVLGHWLTGTQVAVRLAQKYPDRISGLIIVSGAATMYPTDTTKWPPSKLTLKWRIDGTDKYMAPQWFKTVTRETWDDNNFLPGDYAVNPIRALRLWRWAASPMLHTWIRYLCEFYAQDTNLPLDSLKVPVLLLKPGLEGNYSDTGNDYMYAFCHSSWKPSSLQRANIHVVTVKDSRAFIWFDQPERFKEELERFLAALGTNGGRPVPN